MLEQVSVPPRIRLTRADRRSQISACRHLTERSEESRLRVRGGGLMTVELTQRVMDRYFAEMENGDIADVLADDVTWTTTDTAAVVRGRLAVRDHITALHRLMADTQTREIAVANGTAYLEGDCLAAPDATARTAFCLVYDVYGEQITAMRAYGSLESVVGAVPAVVPSVPPDDS
jgi:hypothetical protein